MEQVSHLPRLAVLIDGENISPALAGRVFEEIERFGTVVERRVYGDFSGSAKGWSDVVARFAIDERHCSKPAPGKNGVDMKLVIEALVLLYDCRIDGLCIVSSDSDFTELAKHTRRASRLVYGIGSAPAGSKLREACNEYVPLVDPKAKEVQTGPHPSLKEIREAVDKMTHRDGWYCLAVLGSEAARAKWSSRKYGKAKLGDLLRDTRQFEVKGQLFRPTPLRVVA